MNCRSSAFYSLYKTGFLRALTNRASGGVRYCILAYHGISRKPLSLFTSAPLFESHLRFFARWGVVTSMDEIAGYLRGERVLEGPNLRFVLTFDDGYANVVQNAAPLLRKHRQRGIVYLNPGLIEKTTIPWYFEITGTERPARENRRSLAEAGFGDYKVSGQAEGDAWPMRLIDDIIAKVPPEGFEPWWKETSARFNPPTGEISVEGGIATWEQLGTAGDVLNFGSHTYSHCILGLCRDEKYMRDQVVRSKAAIEVRLGVKCPHFAYPRGRETDYNGRTQQVLAAAGHETAVTTQSGLVAAGVNCWKIPRFCIGETPVYELAARISGVMGQWDGNVSKLRGLIRR